MSKSRSALGRGLDALISGPPPPAAPPTARAREDGSAGSHDEKSEVAEGGAFLIPINLIDRNPEQPRRHFDREQLSDLVASIRRHGVLQPVVVRRAGARYELVVGERRWRASREANLEKIPAIVADVAAPERLEIAIVENVQRQDLNPIELAQAYDALRKAGATQEEIGRKVAKDRSSVANHLRLLELSSTCQQDVERGRLTMGHAKALLQVRDEVQRKALRDQVIARHLSVRDSERLARRLAVGDSAATHPKRRESADGPKDPQLRTLRDELQRRFQTRVQISGSASRGKIEIAYFDGADLLRIGDLLLASR